MKFSEQWLREWVNPPVSSATLAEQLTMLGMEVEAHRALAPDLSAVVVARVEKIDQHPNADKLIICRVDKGDGEPVAVVTGATHVKAGACYPYIGTGGALPGQAAIQAADIRGVRSFGMLCSAAELGFSDDADGLFQLPDDATLGMALTEFMQLDDHTFDVGITPNRGDCLSIKGIAREVAVMNRMAFKARQIPAALPVHGQKRPVHLAAPDGCPRYVGRIINHIDISRPSPLWMREKLRRSGVRGVNAVVDITNFVMLELGQPMHAFDNDKLHGAISVRYADEDEKITLLDGGSHLMPASTLVIADEKEAVAMAGIMGALGSSVTDSTQHLFLESAFFSAQALAGRARQFGLHTDAAHRFERGVDFALQHEAIERATGLVLDICGGAPGPVIEAVAEDALPHRHTVALREGAVERLLGKHIDMAECCDVLSRLGLKQTDADANVNTRRFAVPSHRFDISIEADLIEEIARIHGYQHIASARPPVGLVMRKTGSQAHLNALRQALVHRGYQEAMTYSFVDHALQSLLFPESEGLPLLNAISPDLAHMRISLWPGLLRALQYNINRQQQRVRLFELGKTFTRNGELQQTPKLAAVICGKVSPEQWDNPYTTSSFYDMKSDVEAIIASLSGAITVDYRKIECAAMQNGQSAEIMHNNQQLGLIGALHPAIRGRLNIDQNVYLFEIDLTGIPPKKSPKFTKISKFPSIRRDISVLVDKEIPVTRVVNCIERSASERLQNLELFDVYQGEGIDIKQKSLTLGLTFQGTFSTLKDAEIEDIMARVLDSLHSKFGATLRA